MVLLLSVNSSPILHAFSKIIDNGLEGSLSNLRRELSKSGDLNLLRGGGRGGGGDWMKATPHLFLALVLTLTVKGAWAGLDFILA